MNALSGSDAMSDGPWGSLAVCMKLVEMGATFSANGMVLFFGFSPLLLLWTTHSRRDGRISLLHIHLPDPDSFDGVRFYFQETPGLLRLIDPFGATLTV